LMNIASNKSIAILTIFTTIVGTLNFVVWMYGMNVVLPLQENVYAFWILIGFMILIGITIYFIFNNYLKL
jgi:Mg2+ and Co2+ transporter CorA